MRSLTLLLSLLLLAPPTNPSDADWAHLRTYIQAQTRTLHGDAALFAKLTQPYAPLDLTVTRGDIKSAQSSRDFFYGLAGASAGLSRSALLTRLDNFKRDQQSPSDQATDLAKYLPTLRELIQRFSATAPEVQLIAQWDIPGDLRLNNTFLQHSTVTAFLEHDGFIPYPPGIPFHSLDSELNADHLTRAELDALISSMRSLHIVALLKMPLGVRAISAGLSHNETGLLFLAPGATPPAPGDRWGNGIELSATLSIGPDVFLYEA